MQRLVTWGPRRNNYYYESGKNNSDNVACNDAIIPHNFHSRRLGHPGTPPRRYASHHVIFLFFLWSLLIPIFQSLMTLGIIVYDPRMMEIFTKVCFNHVYCKHVTMPVVFPMNPERHIIVTNYIH